MSNIKLNISKREKNLLKQAMRGLKRNNHQLSSAQEIIKNAIKKHKEKLTIGWSGGKCSTIVLHLALQYNPNITAIYNNTGIEFPENVEYVHNLAKLWNVNLVELHPETSFWKIVEEYGFPKFSSKSWGKKREKWNKNYYRKPMCCYLLKEKTRFEYYEKHDITGDLSGLRAGESRIRAIHTGRMGLFYTIKKPREMTIYNPIALWSTPKCEAYLEKHEIPYNTVYDTQTRNGCWACTAYKGWKKNLLKYNPKMYRLVQHKKGYMLMDDYIPLITECEIEYEVE